MNFHKKILQLDKTILLLILALIGVGITLVFSSSFIFAIEARNDGFFYFKKQMIFAIIGMGALLFTSLMPYEIIKRYGIIAWLVCGAMVVATFIPHIGVRAGGAIRWIYLGAGVYLEPSEFLKICLPLAMGYLIEKFNHSDEKLKTFLTACIILLPIPILLKQPDFGSFTVCSVVVFSLMFIFGLRLFWVISGAAAASFGFYFLVMNVPYRHARLMAFLDPWAAIQTGGYQVIQSLLSFYSGGFMGAGLGQGQGKLYFLPEAHTDFILSVLGEETGFIGVTVLFLLYGFLIVRSFQIAARVKDMKAQIIAVGLCTVFAIQVLINLGVVFGLLPTKGLALPFLSYGGSSVIASCILFGLLLNIQRSCALRGK